MSDIEASSIEPKRVLIDSDGGIVVAGEQRHFSESLGNGDRATGAYVFCLRPIGTLDSTFGSGDGVVEVAGLPHLFDQNLFELLQDETIDTTDHSIVLSMFYSSSNHLVKLGRDGERDTAFGSDGFVDLAGTQGDNARVLLATQSDRKILAASSTIAAQQRLFRVNPNGTLDASFGRGGSFTGPNTGGPLTIGPDGSITQTGATWNVEEQDLQTVRIMRRWSEEGPAGLLFAKNLAAPPARRYTFSVEWRDDDSVDSATLSEPLHVTGPDGRSRKAYVLSVDSVGGGTMRRVLYRIAAPGGAWDRGDNGTYTINYTSGRVKDINGAAATPRALGSFTVRI